MYKVGDKVRSKQSDEKYTGVIISINKDEKYATVKRDGKGDYDKWLCNIVEDKIATAHGVWDGKSFLELVSDTPSISIMDTLRTIPARIKKLLSKELANFYKLGWVDSDLDPTARGVEALNSFLFDKYEKELGVIAKAEVKKALKASKKKEVDEDEE